MTVLVLVTTTTPEILTPMINQKKIQPRPQNKGGHKKEQNECCNEKQISNITVAVDIMTNLPENRNTQERKQVKMKNSNGTIAKNSNIYGSDITTEVFDMANVTEKRMVE